MEVHETEAQSVKPPSKQFLSDDQFAEVWDTRGLKYRMDEFHQLLLNRGLQPYVDRPKFQQMVREILRAFLVAGEARRNPKTVPMQRFPKVY